MTQEPCRNPEKVRALMDDIWQYLADAKAETRNAIETILQAVDDGEISVDELLREMEKIYPGVTASAERMARWCYDMEDEPDDESIH